MVRVVDDGHGIRPDDLPLAFANHATSKLACADDLFSVHDERVRAEIALFAAKVDIDEEMERLRTHLAEVDRVLKQGGSAGQWVCKETAPPSQSKFTFRATQDGEYWFAFATVDKAGTIAPADLDKQPPGLIVVVDTKPPEIDVGPVRYKQILQKLIQAEQAASSVPTLSPAE